MRRVAIALLALLAVAGGVLLVASGGDEAGRGDDRDPRQERADARTADRAGRKARRTRTRVHRDDPRLRPTQGNGLACRAAPPVMRRRGPRSPKRIALTFDDGPSPYTKAFLRVLRRHRAPATFFVLGRQIAGREAVLRGIIREGHALGSHGWSHRSLAPADADTRRELRWTRDAIRASVGRSGCLMRPPGGDIGGRLRTLLRKRGEQAILWRIDPQDWRRPGSPTIVRDVLAHAFPGAIVVLHDGGGDRTQTLKALPTIIRGLRERRYRLVTVPTLLGLERTDR
ncbi:MAG: polysaccharide deacetylase family protein [Solirubrobacteraceae bacterium]|nr:polysaccharide deacetylase family protein [Solirubrobacteraceae bacterium]